MDTAVQGLLLLASSAWAVPLGLLIGMFIGAIPGLSGSGMLAVLLPVLITLPPEIGLIFAISLYAGGEVGNSYPAIILNMPGDGSGVLTAAEGHPMMLRGEGGIALGMATTASMVGAAIAGIATLTATPFLSTVALRFSSVEICIVVLFGLVTIAQISSGGLAKGLLFGFLGLLIATTGTDPMWGSFRGTFGSVYLYDGIPVIPVLIGLLAFSEVLLAMERGVEQPKVANVQITLGAIWEGFLRTIRLPFTLARSSVTGILVGIVPGAGTTIASFLSYQQALSLASAEERRRFGKGATSGLVAADCGNNACVGGTLVPLLTLGIPGSSAGAIMLVIMGYHNLNVGPRLFSTNGDIAYAVLWSQFLAAVLILAMGTIIAWFAYRLALIPVKTMIPVISVFCLLGSFATNQYVFDMGLMLLFGVIGYFAKKQGYPVIALLLGIILGPVFESHLNRGLRMGFGSPEIFFTRPLAIFLWVLLAAMLIIPPLLRRYRRRDDDVREIPLD
jgi:putative tricarboxylic transport membrane protein